MTLPSISMKVKTIIIIKTIIFLMVLYGDVARPRWVIAATNNPFIGYELIFLNAQFRKIYRN